jgi:hypothetical protein
MEKIWYCSEPLLACHPQTHLNAIETDINGTKSNAILNTNVRIPPKGPGWVAWRRIATDARAPGGSRPRFNRVHRQKPDGAGQMRRQPSAAVHVQE